jgi:ATP-dependent DNA helicase RecG
MPLVELSTPIQYVKGVGPVRAQALETAGIVTVEDLLYYFPRRHLDRTTVTPIRNLARDQVVTVVGKVEACGERQTRSRKLFQAIIADGTGLLNLIWFNGIPYVKQSLKVGDRVAVHGKVEFFNGFQIVHPEYDVLNRDEDPLSTGMIVPLYPLTKQLKQVGLDNRQFRKLVRTVHQQISAIPELFPPKILEQYGLVTQATALRNIHFAETEIDLSRAVQRLKFEEHFFLQLLMALRKASMSRMGTRPLPRVGPQVKLIYDQLEFELTAAQKRVIREIREDLARPVVMNRLLQGDVGSGKTIVAILTAAIAVGNGVQVAVMAPTEILAHQHYASFRRYTEKARIPTALLVGNLRTKERQKLLTALKEGRISLVVGTHALIQKDVEFKELGLVIVDEQHRFGVVQRGDLVAKGLNPHFLAMTATPIPRTLAITYHGDMDLSIIDEMPRNRKPVVTRKVEPERLPKVYRFMKDQVRQGRQCMIVYPLVEETEKSDLAAAVEGHDHLAREVFPEFKVGLIHGRMKKEEKDAVMDAFARNEIQILVATTVIEVGIDVPNATVMLIEHAERFGLTQLHQLRGRVGRGSEKSYCIMVQRQYSVNGQKRLTIMERTHDGFEISDEDLKMRGPGEFFGIRQSGFLKYRIANLVTDGPLIREARQAAFDLVAEDPHLRRPEYAAIRRRFLRDYQQKLEWVSVS